MQLERKRLKLYAVRVKNNLLFVLSYHFWSDIFWGCI